MSDQLSRSEFLKIGGIGAASLALAGLMEACGVPKEDYLKLANRSKVLFRLPDGENTVLEVRYNSPSIDPIYLNKSLTTQKDGVYLTSPQKFERGGKMRIMIGTPTSEIPQNGLKLVKLKVNPELEDGYTVGVYRSPGPPQGKTDRIYGLEKGQEGLGLQVATWFDANAWSNEKKVAAENSYKNPQVPNIGEFTPGWAVGTLYDALGEGNRAFLVTGYVHRSEPLIPA